MTRYRGGLSKGDVIAANRLIAEKAKAKQHLPLPKKDACAPAHKPFVPKGGKPIPAAHGSTPRGNSSKHRKQMVKRYTYIYGSNIHQCTYCPTWIDAENTQQYTLDHMVPLSAGGTNNPENHVPACLHCNRDKAQLMPHEWLNVLKRRFDKAPGTDYVLAYKILRLQMLQQLIDSKPKRFCITKNP